MCSAEGKRWKVGAEIVLWFLWFYCSLTPGRKWQYEARQQIAWRWCGAPFNTPCPNSGFSQPPSDLSDLSQGKRDLHELTNLLLFSSLWLFVCCLQHGTVCLTDVTCLVPLVSLRCFSLPAFLRALWVGPRGRGRSLGKKVSWDCGSQEGRFWGVHRLCISQQLPWTTGFAVTRPAYLALVTDLEGSIILLLTHMWTATTWWWIPCAGRARVVSWTASVLNY